MVAWLDSWLIKAGELWLVTIAVVVVVSLIHYFWSTRARQQMATKYKRRSARVNQQYFDNWRLGRNPGRNLEGDLGLE